MNHPMQHFEHGGAHIAALHDGKTGSWQYVVSDPATKACAIIDPVWDFDEKAAATSTRNAEVLLAHVRDEGLQVEWILDTHPHADHFSAAPWLKARLGAPTAIGDKVTGVQALWKDLYGLDADFPPTGGNGTACSWLETPSGSAGWRDESCSRRATRWRRSPMSSAATPSCMTP
ncbi:MBL fold metallo-hydrolase [Brevundimonas denitrificans]|uniref:MBL fold metallo-hydrolase n=1 Tax=Brevundimonas denitrificans TaxID=1443434 RepID=UPI00352FB4BE